MPQKTFGSIRYDSRGSDAWWTIAAQPDVMTRLKRIFPRVQASHLGGISINDSNEVRRDLEWIMTRWAMEISDEDLERISAGADDHRGQEERVTALLAGKAKHADMPMEPARPLRDYQKLAHDIVETTGALLLADELGLGKTSASLASLSDPGNRPMLAVTLNGLQKQWLRELGEVFPDLRGVEAKGTKPYDLSDDEGNEPDLIVMNYAKLAGWADHLAGRVKSVVFDEVQELRRDGSQKHLAARQIAHRAGRVAGLSVAPSSTITLAGGPFGRGWTGEIEEASRVLEQAGFAPENHEDHLIYRIGEAGVLSRGWDGDGFSWKAVKSLIKHELPTEKRMLDLKASAGVLSLTEDHSVYRVEDGGLTCPPASEISVGDVVAMDDGRGWQAVDSESPIDVPELLRGTPNAQVTVDLSDVTRHELGMKAWQWQNSHREGQFGTRLPLETFLAHREKLPEPTHVYIYRTKKHLPAKLYLSEWAYFLGFYLGDGWVSETRVGLCVENSQIESIMDEMRSLPGAGLDPSTTRRNKGSVEVRAGHPVLVALLKRLLGDEHACHDKMIPGEWITTWPERARRELLSGLLDSDGYIEPRKQRRNISTTSRNLAQSIHVLLSSLGVMAGIYTRQPAPGGVIDGRQIVGRRVSYTVQWPKGAYEGKHDWPFGSPIHHDWSRNLMRQSKVRSVVDSAERPSYVYDLEMEGHPSFIANGVLVHNSATPVYNFGGEMHSILSVIAPDAVGSKAEFGREWCGSTFGLDRKTRIADPEGFRQWMTDQGIFLRRTREEVGIQMPELTVTEYPVDVDDQRWNELLKTSDVAQIAEIILNDEADHKDKWRAAGQLDYRMRYDTGMAKAPGVAAIAKLILESEEKILLAGWHRDCYGLWAEQLAEYNPVLYTGTESAAGKRRSFEAFTEGDSRIMMISLRSGAGLDGLQGSCRVALFGELDWSPGVHKQLLGRLHRPGQTEPVTGYFCVSDYGSDPVMLDALDLKKIEADLIVNGPSTTVEQVDPEAQKDRMRQMAQEALGQAGAKQ